MTAKIEFRDLKTNNVLWDNPQWVYREEYEATAGTDALDPNAFLAQGSDALERVGIRVRQVRRERDPGSVLGQCPTSHNHEGTMARRREA